MQTTCKKSSSAAEIVTNIEDLLLQILLRLQARSISVSFPMRLQALALYYLRPVNSEALRSLLSSPAQPEATTYFNTIPLGNGSHPPPSQVINPYKFFDQSLVSPHASTCRILQSCNGLLLCMAYSGEGSGCRWHTSSTLYMCRKPHYQSILGFFLFMHRRRILRSMLWFQYFDVDKEESVNCTVFSPPSVVISDKDLHMWNIEYRYFGESGGHLHLIDIYKKSVFQFDVMEMGKDYSGWFVKYHVDDLDPVAVAFPEMLHQFSYIPAVVLIVSPEEKEDDPKKEDPSPQLLLHILDELISYCIKDKTFKKSSITTGNCFVVEDCSPGYYMESIASVR